MLGQTSVGDRLGIIWGFSMVKVRQENYSEFWWDLHLQDLRIWCLGCGVRWGRFGWDGVSARSVWCTMGVQGNVLLVTEFRAKKIQQVSPAWKLKPFISQVFAHTDWQYDFINVCCKVKLVIMPHVWNNASCIAISW